MNDLTRFILVVFILLFSCSVSTAATIESASCSEADINTAIGSASTGDTIYLNGGESCSATWSGEIDIATKELTLLGGGKAVTLITNGTVSAGENSRLTEIGFTGTLVSVDGDGWRIDHNSFTRDGNSIGVRVLGTSNTTHPTGLIDNNVFDGAYILVFGNLTPADRGNASGLWALDTGFGTGTNVVFVEDNEFSNVYYGMDAGHGGRFVYRHNTCTAAPTGPHGVQSLDYRSNSRMEIYNNSYTTPSAFESAIKLRGGTALVFNNSVTGSYTDAIAIDNQTSTRYGDYALEGCSSIGMACDGTNPRDGNRTGREGYPCRDQIGRGQDVPQWGFTNITSITKGNPAVVSYTYLYGSTLSNGDTIIIDEVAGMTEVNGRSFTIANKNDAAGVWTFELQGEDSSEYGAVGSGGLAYKAYNQTLSPLYSWNNTNGGVDASAPVIKHENPLEGCTPSNLTRYNLHLIADRDFFYSTAIQTSKGDPFDGTSGVGYGLLAYRPDTCDPLPVETGVPNEPGGGVAYWATDTNTLYRCSDDDTWTVHYTPYTYPHPLRQEGTAALTGTALNISETQIAEKTVIITLSGDVWSDNIGTDHADTTALIQGLDSNKSEATGWNAKVRDLLTFNEVTRTSDTVATITLHATAHADYDITETETITATIAAQCLVGSDEAVVATPTFYISFEPAPLEISGGARGFSL